MPEGPAGRRVEAAAKSIDGAEHSSRIDRVMLGSQLRPFVSPLLPALAGQ